MKKYIITCAALFAMSYFGYAQVGIGTKDPNKSAALDIQSTNKGVLLPRLPLTSKTSLSPVVGNGADAQIKGMIVYNTNSNLDPLDKGKSEGFYFWNGSAWDKLTSYSEIKKYIDDNTSQSNYDIDEIVNLIVNDGNGKLEGSSVVMYDFDKKEFYTLVKGKDGKVTTSTPIDLGFGDVIRYKVVDGKTLLYYKDKDGKEQTLDLGSVQVDTFIRDIKDKNNKVTGYVYFNEEAIAAWLKANPKDAHRYKTDIPNADGKVLDIVGDVANNLQEIFNSKKDVFETFITEVKGNVTVKVEGDRTYLVYKDDKGKEVKIDLSQLETETFIRTISNDVNGVSKVLGYVHFNETQISKWIKANPGLANDYKTQMKNSDGTYLDIVGAVTNNFKDILEANTEYVTKIIQETKGNVTVKTENGKTYLVYRDDKGNEVKLDLSAMELVTFTREIKNDKKVVTGYVYFNEDAIAKWIKENSLLAPLYQTQMPDSVGFKMDVVGTVSNNFEEIINKEENKKYITNVIDNSTGNVTVKVIDGKTVLVYKDDKGKEQVIDLSSQEVDTFIAEIKDKNDKVINYVYYSENAIAAWQKKNKGLEARYKEFMKPTDGGFIIDVVGTVTKNFQEIVNNEENKKFITEVVTKTEGNVTVKVVDGKTVLVYKDDKGKEQVIDLSTQEVDTFVLENIDSITKKIINYVYFGESAITDWKKANPKFADEPKKYMKPTEKGGVIIDVVGAVSQNFQEIINKDGNKEFLTQVIQTTEGNVTVKVVDGKTVLVYKDVTGEHVIDLNALEVDTFVMANVDPKTNKIINYIYFGELAITNWKKLNPKFADEYMKYMKSTDLGGNIIDVVGAVSQNFQEIINKDGNKEFLTQVIQTTEGNVTVEVKDGKTYLVYKDDKGVKQTVDLSAQEVDTFVKEIKDTTGKVTGYVYFSESAITKWIKDNTGKLDTKLYKDLMKVSDGITMDIVGTVSNNFKEIVEKNETVITNVKGNVTIKVEGDKTFLVYKDEKGVEQKVDLSSNETVTFVRPVLTKNAKGEEKVTGYIYFNEEAIAKWLKGNPGKQSSYQKDMPDADGRLLDIVGDISNSFQDIVNKNETVINNVKGNVTVKVEGDKTFLVYKDDKGVEQKVDLSAQEVDTFVRIVPGKDSKGKDINLKYVYFGEAKIAAWLKANPTKSATYKADMPESEGTVIDVLTDVTNNLGDIITKSGDAFTNILNQHLTKGGSVFYGKLDEKDPKAKEVLYSVEKNAAGEDVKKVIDLSATIKEVIKDTNSDLIKELKEAVSYNITSAVTETNIKYEGKVVSTFSLDVTVNPNDALISGMKIGDLIGYNVNIFDVKLYTVKGQLVTVGITDIIFDRGDLEFTLGSGDVYTPIKDGKYKAVIQFTK